MGAYLSSPVKAKQSEFGENEKIVFGATTMQGWRVSQEDAHNCILNFDAEECSLFAVYDGHGGAEVSDYASRMFPDFLKSMEMWSKGRPGQALEDAFIKFDENLLNPTILDELKRIAGVKKDDSNDDEGEPDEDKALLYEEACLPLEEVLKKYGIKVKFERGAPATIGESHFISPKTGVRKRLLKRQANHEAAANEVNSTQDPEDCESDNVDVSTKNCFKRARNGEVKSSCVTENGKAETVDGVVGNSIHDDIRTSNVDEEQQPIVKRTKIGNGAGDCSQNNEVEQTSKVNIVSNNSETNVVKVNGHTEDINENCAADTTTATETCNNEKVNALHNFDDVVTSTTDENGDGGKASAKSENNTTSGEETKKGDTSTLGSFQSESEEDDENEDDEYNSELNDEDDSSGESSEESPEEDEVVDEEDFVGDEDEEDDDEGMFPVPSGETPGVDSGTTACVAVIRGSTIYVANAGDSRCVLCRKNDVAVDLSIDHKPEDLTEKTRIENAGGKITSDGRVNGGLNLSRAIGDHFYKKNPDLPLKDQMITPLPDIRVETLEPTDKFLVLACDGIWNSMSSQEVVDFVSLRLRNGLTPSKICEELCDYCLAPSTAGDGTGCDNMTAIVVQLKQGDGVHSERKNDETSALVTSFEKST